MVVGVLLWNDLPDVMATHWGINNEPDGWSSKGVAVFGNCLVGDVLRNVVEDRVETHDSGIVLFLDFADQRFE